MYSYDLFSSTFWDFVSSLSPSTPVLKLTTQKVLIFVKIQPFKMGDQMQNDLSFNIQWWEVLTCFIALQNIKKFKAVFCLFILFLCCMYVFILKLLSCLSKTAAKHCYNTYCTLYVNICKQSKQAKHWFWIKLAIVGLECSFCYWWTCSLHKNLTALFF